MFTSLVPDGPGAAAAGVLVGSLYLLLVAIAVLATIFSKTKSRRDAALEVLRLLLWRRRGR